MRRFAPYAPTILAASACAWWGADFTFLRDITGTYQFYLTISPEAADWVVGPAALLGAGLMLVGLAAGREVVTRAGYLAASVAFGLFALGFLLHAGLVDDRPLGSSFSAATPGVSYGLLSVWMFLTAATEWGTEYDPHA